MQRVVQVDELEEVEPLAVRVRGAYLGHPRVVELAIGLLALSGLLLLEGLALSWALVGPVLLAHVVGGTLLMGLVVLPYCVWHRSRLARARRPWIARAGRAIEVLLLALALSGLQLFLFGNPGGWPGRIAHELHLWLTLPLVALIAAHMGGRSVVVGPIGRGFARLRGRG